MSPLESARIIKNHVSNGLILAKKYRLPDVICEIIQQHHGDSKIKFFLHKALETSSEVDLKEFMYDGPKPQTKEAAIVMIADICESTAKSAVNISETTLKKIVHDTINNVLVDEELSEAPITLKELTILKRTILPILCNIYRKRIEYPDEKY
jgi:membrane-associated HD superfamily phosphohydrolase